MNDFNDEGSIQWKWVLISILIFFVAQVVVSVALFIVGLLTLGIGFLLFIFLKPIAYFVTGVITGYISPGITIREPAIGAIVIAGISLTYEILKKGDSKIVSTIIVGVIAYFVALAGAKIGERMQGNPV